MNPHRFQPPYPPSLPFLSHKIPFHLFDESPRRPVINSPWRPVKEEGSATEAPDLFDYCVGVRGFRGFRPDWGLLSHFTYWRPGTNYAACFNNYLWGDPAHPATRPSACSHWPREFCPGQACKCGLYAYNGLEGFAKGVYGPLWVAVHGWGRVAAHEQGFRSQYARVVAVLDNSVMFREENPSLLWPTRKTMMNIINDISGFFDVPIIPLEQRPLQSPIWTHTANALRNPDHWFKEPDLSEFGQTIAPEHRGKVDQLETDLYRVFGVAAKENNGNAGKKV